MPGRKAEQYKRTKREKAAPGGEREPPTTSKTPSAPNRHRPKQGETKSRAAKAEPAARSQEQRPRTPKTRSRPQRSAAPGRLRPGRPGKRAGPPASLDRRQQQIGRKPPTDGQRPSAQTQNAQTRPKKPAGKRTQRRKTEPSDRLHPRNQPRPGSEEEQEAVNRKEPT